MFFWAGRGPWSMVNVHRYMHLKYWYIRIGNCVLSFLYVKNTMEKRKKTFFAIRGAPSSFHCPYMFRHMLLASSVQTQKQEIKVHT